MLQATTTDAADIAAFLGRHAERALFPLNNLARYGMAGGHDHAVTFWVTRKAGQITDVLTVTDAGIVLPFLPSGDFSAAAAVLTGRQVIGIIGPCNQTRGFELAAGLQAAPRTLDHDEPHFLLSLDQLIMPDGPGRLVPLADAPTDVIQDWMLDYQVSMLNTPANRAVDVVAARYANFTGHNTHMALMDGAVPLAMTGFNAALPDVVQIGGVYTPPPLRGRGHARRAVALHLAQARDGGVTRATLFSASDAAARAYRAIGFERIGDWTLLLFDGSQHV
jgi:GNAT superfamily N-acetyltransferase